METKTYQFTVTFREDDGVIIATVPLLPGCVSYGKTIEEAEQNIQEAITCHVESMLEDGETIPIEEQPARLSLTKALFINPSKV